MSTVVSSPSVLCVAPSQVLRGHGLMSEAASAIARLGRRPLFIGGDRTLTLVQSRLQTLLQQRHLHTKFASYGFDCSENTLSSLQQAAQNHKADVVVGVGGGKALDAAKLLAHQCGLPVVTMPTSGATCAAWTALSNVYSETGAFLYDVPLPHCPDVLVLDYELIATAPPRTLIAGIGDAIAKWYEASVSSGHSQQAVIIAAVQQARVLRDLLFQKSATAIAEPGSQTWQDVVDATVLLAGVIGGLGGAQCRTVAAHAVHNGLTHLPESHDILHGEKVAYGILVQLRLEELIQHNQLAAASRQQLLGFYAELGLPTSLQDMGLGSVSVDDLHAAAAIACQESSDIHHLPFAVDVTQLVAAMVSTTAPCSSSPRSDSSKSDYTSTAQSTVEEMFQ